MEKLTIKQRIKAPTPPYWKKVMRIGASIAGSGLAIIAAVNIPEVKVLIDVPDVVEKIAGYMIAIGGVLSGIAKTAVDFTKI
jgi:hypothetical protein